MLSDAPRGNYASHNEDDYCANRPKERDIVAVSSSRNQRDDNCHAAKPNGDYEDGPADFHPRGKTLLIWNEIYHHRSLHECLTIKLSRAAFWRRLQRLVGRLLLFQLDL